MTEFGNDAFVEMALRLHHGLAEIHGEDVPLFERFIANGWATGDALGMGDHRSYTNAMLLPVCYTALNLPFGMGEPSGTPSN